MENKSIRLLLTALLMLMSNFAHATSAFGKKNADGVWIYYEYDSYTDKTLSVTVPFSGEPKYSKVVNIPETVEFQGEYYRVTKIGDSAFSI